MSLQSKLQFLKSFDCQQVLLYSACRQTVDWSRLKPHASTCAKQMNLSACNHTIRYPAHLLDIHIYPKPSVLPVAALQYCSLQDKTIDKALCSLIAT